MKNSSISSLDNTQLINILNDVGKIDSIMLAGKRRVLCLYRVSTEKQVDDNDIPMQRIECRRFVEKFDDWVIVAEFAEMGVSGYKLSASKRDQIVDIRCAAEKKQFDILLVFMPDRLGRREDETPFLIQWFFSQGIEVWSTTGGQLKCESHIDKLLTYITFWTAEGESEKTSVRVKTKQKQMIEDGEWRGGTVPYGFCLKPNGKVGRKNRIKHDLSPDPVQSEVVKMIFDCVCYKGYGVRRTANHIQSIYPDCNKLWKPTSIRRMLSNPIYTGRLHANGVTSPPLESIRIISDEQFQFTQEILENRISRSKCFVADEKEQEAMGVALTKTEVFGASLLSGLLYCAHCNAKLYGTYAVKNRSKKPYYRGIYRDHNKALKTKPCQGQTAYSSKIIDDAVLDAVRHYFNSFANIEQSIWSEQIRMQLKRDGAAIVRQGEQNLQNAKNAVRKIKDEICKSIVGESIFDTGTLKELLEAKKNEETQAQARLISAKQSYRDDEKRNAGLIEKYHNVKNWAAVFDTASIGEKRMILSRLIKRITIGAGYELRIHFYIALDDFKEAGEHSVNKGYSIVIEEGMAV